MKTSRLTLIVTIAAFVAAILGGTPSIAGASACPPPPRGLSPPGRADERFAMLVRVNQVQNARTYVSHDWATGGLADSIRPQDVFVINTRFAGSTPDDWSKIARILRRGHPCNRIASLNGFGGDPGAPGYAYALAGDPRVWALLTDWEHFDWSSGRFSNPYLAQWSGKFDNAAKRARRWIDRLVGAAPRAGLVPALRHKWDYGELARNVSGPHRRLAPGRRGLQSVQTQDVCATGGGRGMKATVGALLREYKLANFKRAHSGHSKPRRRRQRRRKWTVHPANLGVQVSFTHRPVPWSNLALLRTSPERASKCTRTALKRGTGAILYWASPDSMRVLLSLPRMCAVRPWPGC